jgi:flagellin FlaB
VFGTDSFDLRPDQFGVIELEDADSSCTSTSPVINRGDKVMLTVNLSACFFGLEERCDVWGMVIPEDGSPGIFGFRTPASYTDTVYDLY